MRSVAMGIWSGFGSRYHTVQRWYDCAIQLLKRRAKLAAECGRRRRRSRDGRAVREQLRDPQGGRVTLSKSGMQQTIVSGVK